MSKDAHFGYVTTAVAGAVNTWDLLDLNIGSDFAIVSATQDKVIVSNTKAPLDQPETFTITKRVVKDLFSADRVGTLDPATVPSTRSGIVVTVTHDSWIEITDTVDTTFRQLVPHRDVWSMTTSLCKDITDANVLSAVARTAHIVTRAADSKSIGSATISMLRRGILKPLGLS